MRSAVRKMGNSSGVIIPKPLLSEIGAKAGDDVDMIVEAGRIVIAPIRTHPRVRWADDARKIALADDDELVWPAFANANDADLTW